MKCENCGEEVKTEKEHWFKAVQSNDQAGWTCFGKSKQQFIRI